MFCLRCTCADHARWLPLAWCCSDLAANVTAAVKRLMQRHPGAPVFVSGHRCAGGFCMQLRVPCCGKRRQPASCSLADIQLQIGGCICAACKPHSLQPGSWLSHYA